MSLIENLPPEIPGYMGTSNHGRASRILKPLTGDSKETTKIVNVGIKGAEINVKGRVNEKASTKVTVIFFQPHSNFLSHSDIIKPIEIGRQQPPAEQERSAQPAGGTPHPPAPARRGNASLPTYRREAHLPGTIEETRCHGIKRHDHTLGSQKGFSRQNSHVLSASKNST